MFKKYLVSLFLSSICISCYAYNITTNLEVDNKTNAPMEMIIDLQNGQKINGQDKQKEYLPPNKITVINIQSGDYSWGLYKYTIMPFEIKGKGKSNNDARLYVKGQLVNYVWGSEWRVYSYFNAVNAATGLTVNPIYSCNVNERWDRIFDKNKLIIQGTPEKELSSKDVPKNVSCHGLKSSEGNPYFYYKLTCYDGRQATFFNYDEGIECPASKKITYRYTNSDNHSETYNVTYSCWGINVLEDGDRQMNEGIGDRYCGTWSNSNP